MQSCVCSEFEAQWYSRLKKGFFLSPFFFLHTMFSVGPAENTEPFNTANLRTFTSIY